MLINSLGLKNFKCFEELDVKFAPITLLTGANSSGKSSLINAILAVLQTESFPLYLSPNGKYVDMGSYEEIVFDRNTKKNIEISIQPYTKIWHSSKPSIKWSWEHDILNSLPKLQELTIKFDGNYLAGERWDFSIRKSKDNYQLNLRLDAPDTRFSGIRSIHERIGILKGFIQPQLNTREAGFYFKIHKEFKNISEIVELYKNPNFYFRDALLSLFTESKFNYIGSFRRPPERTYYQKAKAQSKIDTDGSGFIDQLIEWEETNPDKLTELNNTMRQIELFTEVQSSRLKGGRFEINVKTHPKSAFSSLTDIGFGISQFLPIIVADLQLPKESCLAVSQPEIHLHPKIQAQFGNYLVNQVNNSFKQYIIETHSEYLLNRIRLLLVTGELQPNQIKILYFENDGIKSTVHNVEFTTNGQIKGAPAGFFDTYGIDVMNIAMSAIG